ncbi:hypothetical protein HanRHA438_Chr10g0430971 [Helianthus annuus]|nr:hypothetical protein HanRHA438_Chr10g0430971 [Helianthus annuus]
MCEMIENFRISFMRTMQEHMFCCRLIFSVSVLLFFIIIKYTSYTYNHGTLSDVKTKKNAYDS